MEPIQTINGAPTILKADFQKTIKVYESTGFNYGVHDESDGEGTLTITFDSMPDAQKFATLYNAL